jgi:hypothetical protein
MFVIGCTHQPRESLVVEGNLSLRKVLGNLIHKVGRILEWNTCRKQAGSWVSECESLAIYKCITTLCRRAVTSSLLLLEVYFTGKFISCSKLAIYIVLNYEAYYSYIIDNCYGLQCHKLPFARIHATELVCL